MIKCSISCDAWISISNESFLGVTCHFVTKNFEFKSLILSLQYLKEDHNSHFIFDLGEKLMGVISDSGANFKSAVSQFPDNVIKLPCAGHKLKCVSDLIKIKEISEKKQ
ncbi:zinc finger BED domain-containing 4-like [Brachionus plicatilis]|uniref:Zinc finger BED domain-containing 4-like n=1 Tax=Brachionus plicatilis TaxID=10195 RepID=A0A3M7SU82_BRAPC|nr:zinc finger BED domain-containing 4-like [Brachionus plicatilis]